MGKYLFRIFTILCLSFGQRLEAQKKVIKIFISVNASDGTLINEVFIHWTILKKPSNFTHFQVKRRSKTRTRIGSSNNFITGKEEIVNANLTDLKCLDAGTFLANSYEYWVEAYNGDNLLDTSPTDEGYPRPVASVIVNDEPTKSAKKISIITSISPENPSLKNGFIAFLNLRNDDSIAYEGSSVRFYLSIDSNYSNDDTLLGEFVIDNVESLASYRQAITLKADIGIKDGEYYLITIFEEKKIPKSTHLGVTKFNLRQ